MKFPKSKWTSVCGALLAGFAVLASAGMAQEGKVDVEDLRRRMKALKDGAAEDLKTPRKIQIEPDPGKAQGDKEQEVRRLKDQALDRLQRNLEEQRRQRVDDLIILERK